MGKIKFISVYVNQRAIECAILNLVHYITMQSVYSLGCSPLHNLHLMQQELKELPMPNGQNIQTHGNKLAIVSAW